jgi:hypothetical protein
LAGGKEFPPPDNIVLDGVSRLNNMLVDGQCAMNNTMDTADLSKEQRFAFWGRRLRDMLTIVEQFGCLPCNVILTCWIEEKKDGDGKPTNVFYPDVGGKMDQLTPGEMSNAIYGYSQQGRFFVRTKADGSMPWIGLRDQYRGVSPIDVTIEGKAGERSPWSRVFGESK